MPVCTNCAYPADHVYTTYKTKSNIRLGVCPRCDQFLDPLIEHPDLIILLDLILLKPRVFLHLLFNRGSPPFDADKGVEIAKPQRQAIRRQKLYKDAWTMGSISILAESIVRFLPTVTSLNEVSVSQIIVTCSCVLLETIAQHVITSYLALLALRIRAWYPAGNDRVVPVDKRDGRRENFLPILISLTLLYTSLIPLLLQLVLSIWYTPPPSIHEHLPATASDISLLSTLPIKFPVELLELEAALHHAWSRSDRIWIGTRLLGGMSAGFGLRVLLPTKPWETTAIVLAGWMGAALIAQWLQLDRA
ncbi:uncharacterized protein I303_108476 [Kwoniella dejecticola CBS 10117]|uniref:Protein ARV n=1 Tax=Kwoniella dejecticola CBS 10117 TaxID=1296121 RepID=A0A1A5ZXB0_9TREE|nr:uncharacterized protein I303_07202 [Kwoniella dejecticola CBS 10117]OBR82442.1 hypothetical protein I303_07202 [Kwoniella dejecticola CBS 10117]